MIGSIEIRNYRSVLGRGESGDGMPAILELENDITTLIGKNEAGKSNILAAINRFRNRKPVTKDELCLYNRLGEEATYGENSDVELLRITLHPWVKNDTENQINSIPWLLGPYEKTDIEGLPEYYKFEEISELKPYIESDRSIDSEEARSDSSTIENPFFVGPAISNGDIVLYHYASGDHAIDIVESELSDENTDPESLLNQYSEPQDIETLISQRYKEHLQLCWWFINNAAEVAKNYRPDITLKTSDIKSAGNLGEISDRIKTALDTINTEFTNIDPVEDISTGLSDEYEMDQPDFIEISSASNDLLITLGELEDVDPLDDLPIILDQSEISLAKSQYDLWEDSDTMVVRGLCSQGGIDLEEYSAYGSAQLRNALDTAVDTISRELNAFWDLDPTKRDKIETLDPDDTNRYTFDYDLDGRDIKLTLAEGDGPAIPINQRSDGMRWIITFLLSVIAQPSSQSGVRRTVVTLDDPGIHLHPEAEKLLFRAFFHVTTQAQIIYTTHSPALIDRQEIGRLRIIERPTDAGAEDTFGTKIVNEIKDARTSGEQVDPLSTARDAVGWQLSDSLFQGEETILVEGPSDRDYFYMFNQYLRWNGEEHIDNPTFVSSGGDQLPFLSRILAAEDVNHIILMDDDQENDNIDSRNDDDFDMEIERRTLYYDDCELPGKEYNFNAEVEDMFELDTVLKHATKHYDIDVDQVNSNYPDGTDAPIMHLIEDAMDGEFNRKDMMASDIISDLENQLRENPDAYRNTINRFKTIITEMKERLNQDGDNSDPTD